MNDTISTKYQLAPETIKKWSLHQNDGKYFQELYDFMRIQKIENNQMRNDKYNEKIDRRKRKIKKSIKFRRKSFTFGWKTKKERRAWKSL